METKPEPQAVEPLQCPKCGQVLKPVWDGLLACFCEWGGVRPTVEQILTAAEGTRWN